MTDSAQVPQLSDHLRSLGMDGVSDLFPSFCMFIRPAPGGMGPLGALLADQGALGENETRATVFGSLGVVLDVVIVGDVGCWVPNQLPNHESDPEYPRIDRFLVKEAMSAPFFALSAPSWTDLARLGNLGASDIFYCSVNDETGEV